MHLASPEEGESFLAERWPEARAVSDPDKVLYQGFGLTRGRLTQLFGPSVWMAGFRALREGHGGGRPQGDPLMMSSWFLVRDGAVVWRDLHEHAGSERRWDELEVAWRDLREAPPERAQPRS